MIDLPRSSGVLLHPTSLPGKYGIGEIGPQAHRWLGTLREMGQSVWQILPLGPTGFGDSPYQSLSSFAGNPLLISFEQLGADGLLTAEDLSDHPALPDERVDFGWLSEIRRPLLKRACRRFQEQCAASPLVAEAFAAFLKDQADWLEDYALFTAIKSEQDEQPWTAWPRPLASRNAGAMAEARARLEDPIAVICIEQFLFDRQWNRLREHARELGIRIVGDVPIFVAHDSADVWANRRLFDLDENGQPHFVAGVPPDYFSATGQRWGNPLYVWERHRASDYDWWCRRIERALEWCDFLRIDHFRGFAGYWSIPGDEDTAINGEWLPGPGIHFFQRLEHRLGKLPIIAEDLGVITDDVIELRDQLDLPGMRVLQFAFGGDELAAEYVPENYPPNSVAYTGTHDNDTTQGFWKGGDDDATTRSPEQLAKEQAQILDYVGTDGAQLHWDFLQRCLASESQLAVVPLQDVLGLGTEARMNTPGIPDGNWTWRFQWDDLSAERISELREVALQTQRTSLSP